MSCVEASSVHPRLCWQKSCRHHSLPQLMWLQGEVQLLQVIGLLRQHQLPAETAALVSHRCLPFLILLLGSGTPGQVLLASEQSHMQA